MVLVIAFADAIAARRRQRELLALLARGDPKVPGALVIDYPAAAAYCLPGIRSQIVVSVGTLDLLAPAELPRCSRTNAPTCAPGTTWC